MTNELFALVVILSIASCGAFLIIVSAAMLSSRLSRQAANNPARERDANIRDEETRRLAG